MAGVLRWLVRGVGVALVAAALVVGVVQWQRLQQNDPVLVVGDSMAWLATDQLQSGGRTAGYDVTVNGQPGVTLAERLDMLQAAADTGAPRIVVELGSNDVLHETPADAIDGLIDRAVGILQPARCVVFVNVGIVDGPVELADHFNQHLRDALVPHPNLHEFDWSDEYHRHPHWAADAVHLQAPYVQSYADEIIDAVHRLCP